MNAYQNIIDKQRAYFQTLESRDVEFRKAMLKRLKQILKQNETLLYQAIAKDFGKSVFDTYVSELAIVYQDIEYYTKHLSSLAKPKRLNTNIINMPASSWVYPEPLGCCLIIGAWNYPYQLALSPAIAALAAGNTIVLKPSELACHTASMMAKMIESCFEPEYFKVIEGGVTETTELLKCRFEKIFFTGSSRVGKIVYQAAAKQLTSVTLELGGKSPVVISSSADIKMAAKRIVWGKFLNAGQTCIAPDYILIESSVEVTFLEAMLSEIQKGDYTVDSDSYVQIINQEHVERLSRLIDKEKVYYGGTINTEKAYIEPTILTKVTWDDAVMQEEIFGPIMPVITVKDFQEALQQIMQREKPLAAYLFSRSRMETKQFLKQISSGGVCINDVVMHIANASLPFGGVGNSGIGNYHGKYGFECFSHLKAVLKKSNCFEPNLKYPPYSSKKLKWVKRLMT